MVERRTSECPSRRTGRRSSSAERMSRMSISMCEKDGVPSVITTCSACAASGTLSDRVRRPEARTRSSSSCAPVSSNGIVPPSTARRRSGSLSTPWTRRPRSAKHRASGNPTRPRPMTETSTDMGQEGTSSIADPLEAHAPGLSILMPVYNERATIEEAIREVLATDLPVDFELVVVDDGSTDGTREILDAGDWPEHVTVHHHERNQGKGAAVRTALQHARGRFSAIFDADLEYAPADLGPLLAPLLEGRSRAVFGVRAFNGYTSHSFL